MKPALRAPSTTPSLSHPISAQRPRSSKKGGAGSESRLWLREETGLKCPLCSAHSSIHASTHPWWWAGALPSWGRGGEHPGSVHPSHHMEFNSLMQRKRILRKYSERAVWDCHAYFIYLFFCLMLRWRSKLKSQLPLRGKERRERSRSQSETSTDQKPALGNYLPLSFLYFFVFLITI